MAQLHVILDVLGHDEDVPHDVDLELVKVLVDLGLDQRFELVDAVLNLMLDLVGELVGGGGESETEG